MEFRSFIFPIHTERPITILSENEYLKRVESGTTLSRKQMNRSMIDPYSCTEQEKEELKKARRMKGNQWGWGIRQEMNPICLYCHSEAIVPNKKHISGPFFCPKCDHAIRNNKCVYCDKDISALSFEYAFCRECLRFIDEEQFKQIYKIKLKEIEQEGYRPPKVFFQVCLEKHCECSIDYKSNFWFCREHWEEYKKIRDILVL